MSEPTLTMDVRQAGGSVAVVDIKGEVTAACEPVLMSAYEEASGGGASRVLLNFTGLGYMNSGGIGMLVTLLVRAGRQRQQRLAQRHAAQHAADAGCALHSVVCCRAPAVPPRRLMCAPMPPGAGGPDAR